MANQLINGSGAIGTGFNIYGKFDGSLKERIFELKEGEQTKVINGKTFSIPLNVDVLDTPASAGKAKIFESRRKYEEHFSASAKVEGSFFSFSGSAEATFDQNVTTETTSSFGIYTAKMNQYALKLQNSNANLSPQFTGSQEYKNLPDDFEESNKVLFFRFFAKFGTHYITQVKMGGLIEYSIAVKSSKKYEKTEITAKITAEYGDTFSAEGKTEKTVADTQWFKDTERKVYAEGGDNSILNAVSPSYGKNSKDVMDKWLVTVNDNPAITTFELVPIANLFEGFKADAIREAATAYVRNNIKINSSMASGSIFLKGQGIAPDIFNKRVETRFGRYEIVVLNRKTLEVLVAKSYPLQRAELAGQDAGYNACMNDISRFRNDNDALFMLNVVYTHHYLIMNNRDNVDFLEFIKSCGAGKGYKAWKDIVDGQNTTIAAVHYALVGACNTMENSGAEQVLLSTVAEKEEPMTTYCFLEPRYKSDGSLYGHTPVKMEIPPSGLTALHHEAAEEAEEAVAAQ